MMLVRFLAHFSGITPSEASPRSKLSEIVVAILFTCHVPFLTHKQHRVKALKMKK